MTQIQFICYSFLYHLGKDGRYLLRHVWVLVCICALACKDLFRLVWDPTASIAEKRSPTVPGAGRYPQGTEETVDHKSEGVTETSAKSAVKGSVCFWCLALLSQGLPDTISKRNRLTTSFEGGIYV